MIVSKIAWRNALGIVLCLGAIGGWWFSRGLATRPATVSSSQARQAMTILANANGQKQLIAQGKELAEQVLSQDGKDPIALFTLGWAQHLEGNINEAGTSYDRAIAELQDVLQAARFNQSLILESQGKLPEALEAIRLLLRIEPKHAAAMQRREYLVSKIQNKQ